MRFDNLMIEEVITLAYSVGAPKTNLPDNVASYRTRRSMRSYCPKCLALRNFERAVNSDEGRFHCHSCNEGFDKPFVIQVTPSFAAGSQSSKSDPDWLIIDAHKAGKILDQLKKLPKEARAWALLRYHPDTMISAASIKRFVLALLDTEKYPLKSYSQVDDAIEIINTLISCARGQLTATSDMLAKRIGIEESNFRGNKKWALFKNKIQSIFDQWDTLARHAAHDGLMEIQGAMPKPASARSQ